VVDEGWVELEGVQPAPNERLREASAFAFINLYFLVVGAIGWVVLRLLRRSRPTPEVNFAREEIRLGLRTLAFSEIDEARVDAWVLGVKTLTLIFGKRGGLELSVVLREKQAVVVPERTQELLVRILSASSVGIPFDRYDPKGKFARSGFPLNVTLDEAVDLVANPPLHGEPLPITL